MTFPICRKINIRVMQFYFVEMDDHSTLYVPLTLSTDVFQVY